MVCVSRGQGLKVSHFVGVGQEGDILLVPLRLFSLPYRNVVHGSDSVESAQREIALWFRKDEMTCWEDSTDHWIYE